MQAKKGSTHPKSIKKFTSYLSIMLKSLLAQSSKF